MRNKAVVVAAWCCSNDGLLSMESTMSFARRVMDYVLINKLEAQTEKLFATTAMVKTTEGLFLFASFAGKEIVWLPNGTFTTLS